MAGKWLREKKYHLVNWDQVCNPVSWCKLGVKRLWEVEHGIMGQMALEIYFTGGSNMEQGGGIEIWQRA